MDLLVALKKEGKEYNKSGEEIILCRLCRKRKTTMLGTKLCDVCFNLESGIENDLEVAKKIVSIIEKKRKEALREKFISEYPETHQLGTITLENVPDELKNYMYMGGDLGIQVARNGRVWICINGIAFLRFQPTP
jgi:hypothetical protein